MEMTRCQPVVRSHRHHVTGFGERQWAKRCPERDPILGLPRSRGARRRGWRRLEPCGGDWLHDWRRHLLRGAALLAANLRQPPSGIGDRNRSARLRRVGRGGGYWSTEALMTPHDYLVLAIAALWLVTGFLGLGFTVRRLRRRQAANASRLRLSADADA